MFKKQCLIVALISLNAVTFAMEQRPVPVNINSNETSVNTTSETNIRSQGTTVNSRQIFMHSTGPQTYHNHEHPNFTGQHVSDNPIVNAAGIAGKALIEGMVKGVYQVGPAMGQAVGHVAGTVLTQQLIAFLNEPADEKNARTLLSKNQQITNLSKLRDQVNNFDNEENKRDEELATIAYNLRIKFGHALLAFIERQKNEEVSVITPIIHKVEEEVSAFAIDTKNTKDQDLIKLRKQILKNYGLLIYKQIQFEKESSKPAIVIPVR